MTSTKTRKPPFKASLKAVLVKYAEHRLPTLIQLRGLREHLDEGMGICGNLEGFNACRLVNELYSLWPGNWSVEDKISEYLHSQNLGTLWDNPRRYELLDWLEACLMEAPELDDGVDMVKHRQLEALELCPLEPGPLAVDKVKVLTEVLTSRRDALMSLLTVRALPNAGIYSNFDHFGFYGDAHRVWLQRNIATWPKRTGDLSYPVPGGSLLYFREAATGTIWTNRDRLHLLEYLIGRAEAELVLLQDYEKVVQAVRNGTFKPYNYKSGVCLSFGSDLYPAAKAWPAISLCNRDVGSGDVGSSAAYPVGGFREYRTPDIWHNPRRWEFLHYICNDLIQKVNKLI